MDAAHAAEPLHFEGDEALARARLRALILAMPRTAVIEDREGYLHATFTSRLWRFVDDVEVWLDPATGRADIRSASRVGYGDMGVNRARVDALAAAWAANEPGTR